MELSENNGTFIGQLLAEKLSEILLIIVICLR